MSHTSAGRALGITKEMVETITDPEASPLFTEAEKAAIALALELTRDSHAEEATFARAREHFDERQLVAPFGATRALPAGEPVTLDVEYDGDDLAGVALACGLSVQEAIDLHCGAEYTVAFCGFMPGFAYLVGLPPLLQLPRRSTPRTRVPAGSVAIAAEFAGVYPRESPGGWHLLGHTNAILWDDSRTPPAMLPPGTRVRFRPT